MTTYTRNSTGRLRLEMDVTQAAEDKWRAGRIAYGQPVDAPHGTHWSGDHPLIECHEDLLDSLKYAEEALARGVHRSFIEPVMHSIRLAIEDVREAWEEVCAAREPSDDVLAAWAEASTSGGKPPG